MRQCGQYNIPMKRNTIDHILAAAVLRHFEVAGSVLGISPTCVERQITVAVDQAQGRKALCVRRSVKTRQDKRTKGSKNSIISMGS